MDRFSVRCCALTFAVTVALFGYAGHAHGQIIDWPLACVQFPIADLGNGTLYYAEEYDTSCSDVPELTYLIGDYDYPQICPACTPLNGYAYHRFEGLPSPVSVAFVLQLPEGLAREYSEPTDVQGLKFVQFKDIKGKLVTAKVFAFTIYPDRLRQKPGPDEGRLMVVAMQVAGTPEDEPVKVACKPLDKPESCSAYSATYAGGDQPIPILVLTAR